MENPIEAAEEVARLLAEFKRMNKTTTELHRMQNGRRTMTMELLQIEDHQIMSAMEKSEDYAAEAFNGMARLLR